MSGIVNPAVQFSKPVVEKPEGVYPLNGDDPFAGPPSSATGTSQTSASSNSKQYIYPDFKVWQHTQDDDIRMRNYLQKGYFEPPLVSNEFLSARTTMTTLLHSETATRPTTSATAGSFDGIEHSSSGDTGISSNGASITAPSTAPTSGTPVPTSGNNPNVKLVALSEFMIKAINQRRNLSKIRAKTTYKPPPRVTLTDNKKEKWIENLADSKVSLKQLSRAIPHGIRNRVLLEQCSQNSVPIPRALWLIRCVSTNEQRQLKRKGTAGNAAALTNNWIIEWTEQVTLYIEKVAENCFNPNANANWRTRLTYITRLSAHLYMEALLNQETFLAWVVRSLGRFVNSSVETSLSTAKTSLLDFKYLSTHVIFLRLFWFKIIKVDYLSKELAELLLRISSALTDTIAATKSHPNTSRKDIHEPANKLLSSINFFITYLFYYNSDSFIIPTTWVHLKSALKKVIDMNNTAISEQFKLVSYRNESLMIDLPADDESNQNLGTSSVIIWKLDNFERPDVGIPGLSDMVFYSTRDGNDSNESWKKNLKLMLEWSVTGYRCSDIKRVSLVVSILQWRLLQIAQNGRGKKYKAMKLELEVEILDFIYALNDRVKFDLPQLLPMSPLSDVDNLRNDINFENVFVLVSELYYHDLFVVSSYVRRLIASGVIYLQDANLACGFHTLILKSLPTLSDTNVNNILKGLTSVKFPGSESDALVKEVRHKVFLYLNSRKQDTGTLNSPAISIEPRMDQNFNLVDALELTDQLEIGMRFILAKESSQKLYDLVTQCSGTSNKIRLSLSDVSSLYRLFEKMYNLHLFLDMMVSSLDMYGDCFEIDLWTVNFIISIVFSNHDILARRVASNTELYPSALEEKVARILSMASKYDGMFKSIDTRPIQDTYLQSEDVKRDLKVFRNEQKQNATQTEKAELSKLPLEPLQALGINSAERLLNPSEFSQHVIQVISHYWSIVRSGDRSTRLDLSRLLKALKSAKQSEFSSILNQHIRKTIAPTLSIEFDVNVKFIARLIVDQILSFEDACEAFAPHTNDDNLDASSGQRLVWSLLLNTNRYEKSAFSLEACESIVFELARKDFQEKKVDEYVSLLIRNCRVHSGMSSMVGDLANIDESAHTPGVVDQHREHQSALSASVDHLPTPVSNSMTTPLPMVTSPMVVDDLGGNLTEIAEPCREELIRVLRVMAVKDTSKTLKWVQSEYSNGQGISKPQLIELFNQMLVDEAPVTQAKDTNRLVGVLSYFNLPICQSLVKMIFDEEFKHSSNDEEQSSYLSEIISSVLIEAVKWDTNDYWKDDVSLLGDLFKFVAPPLKLKLLHCCEEILLGSDVFPKVVIGEARSNVSVIPLLGSMISSCSKFSYIDGPGSGRFKPGFIPLSDSLVFSLNLSLEKLMYYCQKSQLQKSMSKPKSTGGIDTESSSSSDSEGDEEIDTSIALLARIILIHKGFLVDLVMKRSINLQTDVFLQNLTKLFTMEIIDSSFKLKNLLYDILLSIKMLISESLSTNPSTISSTRLQQSSNAPTAMPSTTTNVSSGMSPFPPFGRASHTPTGSQSFLSPATPTVSRFNTASYTTHPTGVTATTGSIMSIVPPSYNNKLRYLLKDISLKDGLIALDNVQNLFVFDSKTESYRKFYTKPFDLLEDSSPVVGTNDSSISLQLFQASVEKKNPS
ncbi:unnamed protein product [Kuraishia capsulata CBS 1993]|uniref:Mediator of RNA polymerase II transcription subunit 12 n=1 Tax=Kuraishia capsulata CBS 1993 TaxID=1382522 RepID=W6MPL4_9ASCO|nr:uncharacterized protein KUCA_T00004260001 [Kuraishia capsulata CBS 1993]CDK28278.1 unnamed protein product [Kuraishia capsulata CBS 1993]